jgi:hypothetical protein
MSSIIPANMQVPAHLAGRVGAPSALAASMTGGISSGTSYPRISIKGARFRIVEGDTETVLEATSLDVVVVGANPRLSKTYYAKQWDPNDEATGPDCFSLDGIGPDASVKASAALASTATGAALGSSTSVKASAATATATLAAGGSSLRDFKHTDGQNGYFQLDAAVYGRAGVDDPTGLLVALFQEERV